MCGIIGWIDTPWQFYAQQAIQAIKKRGPDAKNLVAIDKVLLGHTRLAVIDLVSGQQPLTSQDGRYTIVFNGEVYNYNDLRYILNKKHDIHFKTQSDTEVLLYAYIVWGEQMLTKLDGMFAFAIWDNKKKELFAARDMLGIKPFMYAEYNNGLMFASTLAPFLATPNFPRQINYEALRDYLAFQAPLSPNTFCKAVKQLPPAHYLQYNQSDTTLVIKQYWNIPPVEQSYSINFEQAVEQVNEAIQESVKRQLVADVPIGAFLSGGIDSSLLVYYISQQRLLPLHTFSLKFESKQFDETPYAREVAQQLGCIHHELSAPIINTERWIKAIQDLDQPLADPAYVMTHALAELTRQHVTVAISGDGGDELFAGYERYFRTAQNYPAKFWQPLVKNLIIRGLLPEKIWSKTLSGHEVLLYQRGELGSWPVGRKSMKQYIQADYHKAFNLSKSLSLWSDLISDLGAKYDTSTLMRADLWTYLSENCLVKTDRASMAHGLEVRVPLLGRPVLDLALHLPSHLAQIGGTKPVLTALAKRYLPEAVWNRPKHGFSVPLLDLFKSDWKAQAEQLIADSSVLAPALNVAAIKNLWQEALVEKGSRRLVYTFLVLLIWLEKNPLVWD